MFETNGDKIPVSLVRDNMVHASETICPLGGKDDSTSAAVQAKEKAYNYRFVYLCLIALSKYMISLGFHIAYRFFMVT